MKINRKKKLLACTEVTTGKVIGVAIHNDSYYSPVIKYNVNGKRYIKTSNYVTSSFEYSVGQELQIHYNPDDCNMYYIEGDNIQNKVETVYTIAGAFVLTVAVAISTIFT